MRAFIIGLFDQTVTDFASEHFNTVIFGVVSIEIFHFSVL